MRCPCAAGPLLLLVLSLWAPRSSPAQRPSEYQVKVAFLYHFPNFVEWPAQVLPDTATTLTIGVLGNDPFGDAFAPFADQTTKSRRLRLVRSPRLQELPFCHILFISDSEKKYLPQVLEYLKGHPTLTVGETPGFAQAGVMVNFVLQENKVRFEVNAAATSRAGLKLSSRLLKLAILVAEGKSEEQP